MFLQITILCDEKPQCFVMCQYSLLDSRQSWKCTLSLY